MLPIDIAKFPPLPINLRIPQDASGQSSGNHAPSVSLRMLSPDDADKLGAFYESVPAEDFRFYCPHKLDREHAKQNAAKAHSPVEAVLVAETPEKAIAGYAWFRWQEGAQSSTFGICISRQYQGSGLGKALIARIKEIAKVVGPATMSLTVQLSNPKAAALYQKMGFKIVKQQMRQAVHGYPEEPEYAMQLATR